MVLREGARSLFRSIRFSTRKLDNLAPLFGLIGNEFAEIRGRAGHDRATEISYVSQCIGGHDRAHRGQAKIKSRLCQMGGFNPDDWDLPPKPEMDAVEDV
jgi:hypothetical protein